MRRLVAIWSRGNALRARNHSGKQSHDVVARLLVSAEQPKCRQAENIWQQMPTL